MRRDLLPLTLLIAGCHHPVHAPRASGVAVPDAAIQDALGDMIMSDPQLTDASGAHLARSAALPSDAAVPLGLPGEPSAGSLFKAGGPEPTLGQIAGAAVGPGTRCGAISYTATWAARLPPFAPLPRDAAVIDAAGEDRAGCKLRVVRFATALPPARLVALATVEAAHEGLTARASEAAMLAAADANGRMLQLRAGQDDGETRAELVSLDPR